MVGERTAGKLPSTWMGIAQAEYCRASLEAQRISKSIEARLAEVSREYDTSLPNVNMIVVLGSNRQLIVAAAITAVCESIAVRAGVPATGAIVVILMSQR